MKKTEKKLEKKKTEENKMREVRIEKVVLSCGAVKDELDKSVKLLEKITKRKSSRKISHKRIPTFGVRPKMEVGCMVTIRGNAAKELLTRLLSGVENRIKRKQIEDNHFSFGIKEYIEIAGEKYDRDIGLTGLKVTVVFSRRGKRAFIKKIKQGKRSVKQNVSKEEIIKFMEENFHTEIA
jgi:large subunit ribosomal protein L5